MDLHLLLLLAIILVLMFYIERQKVIETANMGVLNQLMSSSTDTIPIDHIFPHNPHNPHIPHNPHLRPVLQRGQHFFNPQWHR